MILTLISPNGERWSIDPVPFEMPDGVTWTTIPTPANGETLGKWITGIADGDAEIVHKAEEAIGKLWDTGIRPEPGKAVLVHTKSRWQAILSNPKKT